MSRSIYFSNASSIKNSPIRRTLVCKSSNKQFESFQTFGNSLVDKLKNRHIDTIEQLDGLAKQELKKNMKLVKEIKKDWDDITSVINNPVDPEPSDAIVVSTSKDDVSKSLSDEPITDYESIDKDSFYDK